MVLYKSKTYINDLISAVDAVIQINDINNSSIMITGAAGLIGSYIVDILLTHNKINNACNKIFALGRSNDRLNKRFKGADKCNLVFIEHDVNKKFDFDYPIDYIIHAASNAYPAVFNNDPVGTIMSNIQGTKNLLDYGRDHKTKKFMFISSGEVYGQGDPLLDSFDESYSGFVDPIKVRSCYPSSKRTAETLCSSYTKQYGLNTIVVRPCHIYGPNATVNDNRANVQFVNDVLNGNNIIMKSAGNQMRSYCYIADAASAILTVLIKGENCEAYNIANPKSRSTIVEFAGIVAAQTGRELVFLNPNEFAIAEKTPILKQVLCSAKLENLGWKGEYSLNEGIAHTLAVLKEIEKKW